MEETKQNLIPNLAVFEKKLWRLRPNTAGHKGYRVSDKDFITLDEILSSSSTNRGTRALPYIEDRVVLSLIVANTFFSFLNTQDSWSQVTLTPANICFLATNRATVDVTNPHLSVCISGSPANDTQRQVAAPLDEPHPIREILSFGILILEILRGRRIVFDESLDRCDTALVILDTWSSNTLSGVSQSCIRAIRSCIDPTELYQAGISTNTMNDTQMRMYIFERVLYPLTEAVSAVHGIPWQAFNSSTLKRPRMSKWTPPADDDGTKRAKQRLWKGWQRHLQLSHDILYHRAFDHPNLYVNSKPVRIAVLDTGLHFSKLMRNYDEQRRISWRCSRYFSPSNQESPGEANGWQCDTDGHGSMVAQVLLHVAPKAVIHIAKVLESRHDLRTKEKCEMAHQNIAEACRRLLLLLCHTNRARLLSVLTGGTWISSL